MFHAKAMYEGGVIIVSANDKLDKYSYILKGLRCIKCNEEVYLKSGIYKKRHFAHFANTNLSNLQLNNIPIRFWSFLINSDCLAGVLFLRDFLGTKCPYRVSSYGFSCSWDSLTEKGQGQRRKLFQEYFMNIIKRKHNNFDENVEILKNQASLKTLEKITLKCSILFYRNQFIFQNETSLLILKNSHSKIELQFLIANEAIEYLCTNSSQKLLEELIHYSIYLHCQSSSFSDKIIEQIEHVKICENIKDIILETDWVHNLDYYHRKLHLTDKVEQENKKTEYVPILKENKTNEYVPILDSVNNYLNTSNSSWEFHYKNNNYKIKLDKLNLKLYCLQEVNKLNLERKYIFVRIIGFFADDVNVILNNLVIIRWEFKYNKDIHETYQYPLCFFKYLQSQVELFLSYLQKNEYIQYTLVNFEEVEKVENEIFQEQMRRLNQGITLQDPENLKTKLKITEREKYLHYWYQEINDLEGKISIDLFLETKFIQYYIKPYEPMMIVCTKCPICENELTSIKKLFSHIKERHLENKQIWDLNSK